MNLLVLIVVIAGGAFFGYPLLNEDTGSECDALERIAVRSTLSAENGRARPQEQLLGQFIQGLSKGQFAGVAVRNQYPDLPVAVGCTVLYWRALIDPESVRRQAARLRP